MDATNQPIVCYACLREHRDSNNAVLRRTPKYTRQPSGLQALPPQVQIVGAMQRPFTCCFLHDDKSTRHGPIQHEKQCMICELIQPIAKIAKIATSKWRDTLAKSAIFSTIYKMARASITARFVTSAEKACG